MMKRYTIIAFISLLSVISAQAQFFYQPVYSDLEGAALLAQLKETYKPSVVLDYNTARDTLFSKVDAVDDTLYCIYTGMGIFIPPGSDPTQAVYMNGIPNGINTEHCYPESKGASGVAKGDMHNLFPSKSKVNSDRADKEYDDIPDNETKRWYYLINEMTSPPLTQTRDLYSETNNDYFEPRESVKGDIARAIFYFYTMYTDQSLAADSHFFENQMETLCEWHYYDPVDSVEWVRNQKIAFYQGGSLNPYILDCSLVSRAFCNNIDQTCEATVDVVDNTGTNQTVSVNYAYDKIQLRFQSSFTGNFICFDMMGRLLFGHSLEQSDFEEFNMPLSGSNLVYCLIVDDAGQVIYAKVLCP
ncbi:MAG: endonuclease [Saprospiraceae bacterium]|nr:endonuclease [Saprospiraceae bacterium]MCB9308946.1 endonuclease [Lewinellaceae bacterium]